MTKNRAVSKAHQLARENDRTYFVYHWTDGPYYPGPTDYHVISDDQYWHYPDYSWLPEDAVIYNTLEGWY